MDRLGTHSKGRDSAHTEHDLYLNYREIHINVIIHTYIYIQIKLSDSCTTITYLTFQLGHYLFTLHNRRENYYLTCMLNRILFGFFLYVLNTVVCSQFVLHFSHIFTAYVPIVQSLNSITHIKSKYSRKQQPYFSVAFLYFTLP